MLSVSRDTIDRLEGPGRITLYNREVEVLLLVSKGMSNGQVASHLGISEVTVKRYLINIYAKLGVSSRANAIKKGFTSGLITVRDLSESD